LSRDVRAVATISRESRDTGAFYVHIMFPFVLHLELLGYALVAIRLQ